MKAERRHELKMNSLAAVIENAPIWIRLHLNKILMVVAGILLVFYVIRYRARASADRSMNVVASLSAARTGVDALNFLSALPPIPVDQLLKERDRAIDLINSGTEAVMSDADGDTALIMRAEAVVTQGDMYWHLATMPPFPGAATQPSLQLPRSKDEYLKTAEAKYQDVIRGYPGQASSVASAELGLAAIAETRRDFETAKQAYQRVIDGKATPDVFKYSAARRIAILPMISDRLLEGPYSFGSTQPTSMPSTAPSTVPNNSPTTSSTPATSPTTAP